MNDDGTDRHTIDEESRLLSDDTGNDSTHLTSKQQYWCDICETTFPNYAQAKYHRLTRHTEGKHKCPHCFKKWHRKEDFKIHMTVCADRKISCELCGKKFKRLYGVKRHKIRVHHVNGPLKKVNNEDCIEEQNQKQNSVEKIDSEKSSIDCNGENSALIKVKDSFMHDAVKVTQNNLQPHVDNPSSGSYNTKCSYCEKCYSNEGFLRRHIEQCHVPFPCNICGITFDNGFKLRYHNITKHMDPKHRCPHCPQTFEKTSRYEVHLPMCKGRKFSCNLCDKKFKALRFVVKHKKVIHHDKEASHCHKNGSEGQNQKQTKMIALKTGDAAHQMAICTICGMTFSSADELMDHKLTFPQQHVDVQSDTDDIAMLQGVNSSSGSYMAVDGVKKFQNNCMIVPQTATNEIKMEIQVEDTRLQEQEYHVPNDDQDQPYTTTSAYVSQLEMDKHPHGGKSKDVAYEDEDHVAEIKIKKECLEIE